MPANTDSPLSDSVPANGIVEISTAAIECPSSGSLNPKSSAAKVNDASSRIVVEKSEPNGASLTALIFMVIVLGNWS